MSGTDIEKELRHKEYVEALATLCSFIAWHGPGHLMGGRTREEAISSLSIVSGLTEEQILRVAKPKD